MRAELQANTMVLSLLVGVCACGEQPGLPEPTPSAPVAESVEASAAASDSQQQLGPLSPINDETAVEPPPRRAPRGLPRNVQRAFDHVAVGEAIEARGYSAFMSVTLTEDGTIWVGGNGTLIRFDESGFLIAGEEELNLGTHVTLLRSVGDVLLVGTHENGLSTFDGSEWEQLCSECSPWSAFVQRDGQTFVFSTNEVLTTRDGHDWTRFDGPAAKPLRRELLPRRLGCPDMPVGTRAGGFGRCGFGRIKGVSPSLAHLDLKMPAGGDSFGAIGSCGDIGVVGGQRGLYVCDSERCIKALDGDVSDIDVRDGSGVAVMVSQIVTFECDRVVAGFQAQTGPQQE